MEFLGWTVIFETGDTVGYKSDTNGDIWFVDANKDQTQDYDSRGLNHIAIRVENQKDIDVITNYLTKLKIETLFETPRHRSEFVDSSDKTYFQVMFKSPDNILFEIVYIGIKEA